jgi:hypothetical protein
MIKQLLSATMFCAVTFVSAQQLTNSGFDSWTSGNPTTWGSFDEMLTNLGITGTTLETPVTPSFAGTNACQLKTQNVPLLGANLSGLVCSGPVSYTGSGISFKGRPYTSQPTDYSFQYKYTPVAGDTAVSQVVFTKWNGTSRDTLAYGGMIYTAAASAFTLSTIPIVWINPALPDSVTMIFASSSGAVPQINTTFIIDDIQMNFALGVSEPFMDNNFSVFPNPASDLVNFTTTNDKADNVMIFDLAGREVAREKFFEKKAQINIDLLPAGLYIYHILDIDGNELKSSKLTISK